MQASSSAGNGSRLCGGRHLRMLAMYTDSRAMPTAYRYRSSSFPAAPTNGMPVLSSSPPGASPTNIRRARESPTPNTDLVRVSHRGHARQSAQRPRRLSSAVPADVSAGVYVSVTEITPFGRTDRRHLRRARPAVAPRRMQGMPASSPQAGYAAWLPPCSGWSSGYISAWC